MNLPTARLLGLSLAVRERRTTQAWEAIIVDSVVRHYGALFGAQLRSLSLVCGPPGARARGEHGTGVIPIAEIPDHFTSVLTSNRADDRSRPRFSGRLR